MRYLIISDIHSNLDALRAVMQQAPPYDRLLCLGDLVGYGASPNEVIQTVRQLEPAGIIRGNHDKVSAGIESGENFNTNAYLSAIWTQGKLTKKNTEYLRNLPQGPLRVDDLVTIAHGSPMDEDYYVLYENDAWLSFQCFDTLFCFFGHSHVPGLFVLEDRPSSFYYFIPRDDFEMKLDLSGATRYLVNPGSIGQPRDYDPRASLCVLDTDAALLSFQKIAYPVDTSVQRIRRAGLPVFLGERLQSGV
jgi:diadenosine tetraphosphatase ApaH/serine/threonine PP2A family protein phosphatase